MSDFLYGPNVEAALSSRGQIFTGSCNDDMTGSTTAIHIKDLRGFGEDLLNSRYYMQVIKNYNAIAAAPIGQTRQITNYVSDTGVFTTAAFTANVEANDRVIVMHESVALFALHADADHSRVVDNSWLAQMLAVDGTIADYDDNTMSHEALNIDLDRIIVSTSNADRITATTEDFQQVAGSYTLFTGTTADVVLLGLTLRNATVDCSDDADFTGISIQTDDVTPAVIISQADGVKANLTSEATIGWDGGHAGIYIKVGTIIKMTIYGAASDAACAPDIVAVYKSPGTGNGTLVA